ncbi:Calcium-regulated heat-stable protein 1 [Varanus komodoensis]|nr:Calcium-regulated heat-stable protein 1 [Varanus komodoensis]
MWQGLLIVGSWALELPVRLVRLLLVRIFFSSGRAFGIKARFAVEGNSSWTVRASEGPTFKGVCKCFCRSKGHGFITPADGGPDIFVHISDIDGEYVPVAGDEVTYKVCTIPPKNEKLQAVEVIITHLAPGTKHETWSGHVVSS